MSHLFMRPALTACPACEYDLTGATVATCPECGYTVAEHDVAADARRRLFLELTRVQMWVRLAALAAASLFLHGWPLILLGLGAVGGRFLVAGMPRLIGRTLLRAWLLSLVWLQLVWLAPLLLAVGWEWIYYSTSFLDAWGDDPSPFRSVTMSAGLAAGLPLWWWSWRRTSRMLLVPRERWTGRRVRVALAIAYGLQCILIGFTSLIAGLLWLLDEYWPGWYLFE